MNDCHMAVAVLAVATGALSACSSISGRPSGDRTADPASGSVSDSGAAGGSCAWAGPLDWRTTNNGEEIMKPFVLTDGTILGISSTEVRRFRCGSSTSEVVGAGVGGSWDLAHPLAAGGWGFAVSSQPVGLWGLSASGALARTGDGPEQTRFTVLDPQEQLWGWPSLCPTRNLSVFDLGGRVIARGVLPPLPGFRACSQRGYIETETLQATARGVYYISGQWGPGSEEPYAIFRAEALADGSLSFVDKCRVPKSIPPITPNVPHYQVPVASARSDLLAFAVGWDDSSVGLSLLDPNTCEPGWTARVAFDTPFGYNNYSRVYSLQEEKDVVVAVINGAGPGVASQSVQGVATTRERNVIVSFLRDTGAVKAVIPGDTNYAVDRDGSFYVATVDPLSVPRSMPKLYKYSADGELVHKAPPSPLRAYDCSASTEYISGPVAADMQLASHCKSACAYCVEKFVAPDGSARPAADVAKMQEAVDASCGVISGFQVSAKEYCDPCWWCE